VVCLVPLTFCTKVDVYNLTHLNTLPDLSPIVIAPFTTYIWNLLNLPPLQGEARPAP